MSSAWMKNVPRWPSMVTGTSSGSTRSQNGLMSFAYMPSHIRASFRLAGPWLRM
jgi:hypothetical protein